MAENTDTGDKILENSKNIESENHADENSSSNDPNSLTLKTVTGNMEAHHHPHIHHKKKWKDYLFEFLMLFLAVTAGFFVENIREHYVENKRANEYALSLYDDFKADTAFIQRTYDEKVWIQAKYDSVQKILFSADLSQNNEMVYYVERYLKINDVFTPQDITYQQLRSSGNFRYFKNVDLYKKMALYYNLFDRYLKTEPCFGTLKNNEVSEMELKMFNIQELLSLDNYNGSSFYDLVIRPQKKFDQVISNKQNLELLYSKVSEANLQAQYSKVLLGWLKGNAIEVIDELKKEYRFE